MACIDYMFKKNYRCTDIVKLFCFYHLNIYLTLLSKFLVAYICYNWNVQTSKIMICLHRNKFDRTLKHISYRGNEMRNERTKLLDFCKVLSLFFSNLSKASQTELTMQHSNEGAVRIAMSPRALSEHSLTLQRALPSAVALSALH